MRKYLAVKGHCPCCFRNGSKFDMVSRKDRRINELQFKWCQVNRLRIFNLQDFGRPCKDFDRTCCVRCLVCGQSVIDQDGHNFLRVKRYVTKDSRRPVKLDDVRADVHCKNAGVFVPQFRTPVHFQCTYVAKCRCRLPLGVEKCDRHAEKKCPIVKTRVPDSKKCAPRLIEFDMPEQVPLALEQAKTAQEQLKTAQWAPLPKSLIAKKEPTHTPWKPAKNPSWKPAKPVNPKKPLVNSANSKKPLVNSANPKKPVVKPAKPHWQRDVPEGEYDERVHGYWRAPDGTYTYRHPDGRVVRGCTGCDEI